MSAKMRWLSVLLLFPLWMQAQSVVELTVDGGFSTFLYQTADAKRLPAFGYGAHIGYAYFFHPNVGIGTGVGFRQTAGGVHYEGEQVWQGVMDTDHEPYDHHLAIRHWHERYTAYYVEFPLALYFRVPLRHVQLRLEIGAKYGLGIHGNAKASGSLTHTGYYEKWHLWLDVDEYGFYQEDDYKPAQTLPVRNMISAFVRAGVAVPLSRVCCLLAGVHAQYGFNTAFETGGESPLGFRDDRPEGAYSHPFMTSYTSLLNTSLVSGKASPLNVGIELGVRFELSPNRYTYRHRRKYPCRCLLY